VSNLKFYRDRAEAARTDANAATLGHVRERWMRSHAAWEQLADRAARAEQMRIDEMKRKAEQPPEKNNEINLEQGGN
jgi:hypothetical protein